MATPTATLRVRLSPQNTARWFAGHGQLHASLTWQARRVARKFRCDVVLLGDDGSELRRFEPVLMGVR